MSHSRLIMLVFFLQPIAFGSWLPRIPDIQHALGLGPAGLALTLLGLPVGTLITLPFAGRLAAKIGARATIFHGFFAFSIAVSLPGWSVHPAMLFIALALVGSAMSTLELGMNVKADQVEKAGTKLIMSTCHGFWSLGIMAGSVIGSAIALTGLAPGWAIMLVAIIVLPIAILITLRLPDIEPEHVASANGKGGITMPSMALLGICLFVFGITMTEGAIADWSAVFLRDVFAAPTAQAGVGYSFFALLVATGRFAGDRLKARYGAVNLARACGVLSVLGIAVVASAPSTLIAFIGFGLVGIGVSVGFPLAVTAAASLTDRPASANVATLSFIALLGFLVGPPMIGFVAQLTGIRIGLSMLLPFLVLSFVLAGLLKPKTA